MSKIRFWAEKNVFISQPVDGQFPVGIPNVDVSSVLAFPDPDRLDGTLALGKNQMLNETEARQQIFQSEL
jgi:hypothetical protein